jgi:hypothetical protein
MSSTLARFNDPDGTRYGLPTFPWNGTWNLSPALATRRQLTAQGLRPGGQEPVAQIMWRSRLSERPDGVRTALLYRVDRAKPKREATLAQLQAILKALDARRTCPACSRLRHYDIPRKLGVCIDCADPRDLEALQ